ncbi:MAG: phosphatase PAP2 family protein [bacterium]
MQESILLFFQRIAAPPFTTAAEIITMLGEQFFFIVVIAFIYWTLSRKEGFKLASIFVFSAVVNGIIKIFVRSPRPFTRIESLTPERLETATSYAFPSGHTQGAASFFTTAALILKRWWVTFIAALLMIAVGVTRVYLRVHWPLDAVTGLAVGVAIALGMNGIIEKLWSTPVKLRRFFFMLETLVFLITITVFILHETVYAEGWMVEDFFKASGMSLGLVAGFFLQERWIRFDPAEGSLLIKVLRYILGLGTTLGILLGLGAVFPERLWLDYLRYGIVGLWVAYVWPAAGVKSKLFRREAAER